MNEVITKAIIPIAGLATRFLPLSKALSKELFPVGVKPMLQYAIEELKAAGVTAICFVVGQNKKPVFDFLRKAPHLEKILEERKYENLLSEYRALEKLLENMSFTFVSVPHPLGDGHAVLQARKSVGEEACFVAYPDDIIQSKQHPCTKQLAQIFKTSQKPVVALSRISKDRISSYGVVAAEKIATRFWKIQKIVEKPEVQSAPSDLAMVGRWVLTPEVFDYLKKAKPNKRGEIVLNEVLGEMTREGKMIYGYEFEGTWWECGDRAKWLRSHFAFSLQHPELGPQLQKFLREEKIM